MSEGSIAETIRAEYDETEFPAAFLSGYDRMECLSDNGGRETFIVQKKESGEKFIAKCFDKSSGAAVNGSAILKGLSHAGLPKYIESFENDAMTVVVREYVEGTSLDRYAADNEPDDRQIVKLCVKLADILICLHTQSPPVIHRDIKPQNVIVKPDGSVALIDFDISRFYHDDADTDTQFFGTRQYAPPEQYGFSQTDARADIYSFGILLRFLLTGSTKENKNIRYYRPLMRIVQKCTAFSPKERYADMKAVKKALLAANPRSQFIRKALISVCSAALCALIVFGGVKLYQYVTYTPFTDDAIPGYLSDEERTADSVAYLKAKFGTSLFDESDEIATVGFLRQVFIEVYGLDAAYANGINDGMPAESEAFFLPWGWDDGQNVARDVMVYAAVKLYDPSIVADWSGIKDDNGYYPGVRAAVAFAEKTGLTTGANPPGDITIGDMAIILANTDRVFAAAETEK